MNQQTNKIDEIVLQLLKKVNEKKAQIGAAERPSWRTNCVFKYDPDANASINLQTVTSVSALISIAGFIESKAKQYESAALFLGVNTYKDKFSYLGFGFDDWISDIKTRLSGFQIKAKRDELAKLEERVNALVSPEQRRAIELEKLVKEIG